MDFLKACLRKYCSFDGRAGLGEYWSYQIAFLFWTGIAYLMAEAAASGIEDSQASAGAWLKVFLPMWLPALPPMIAVGVRRMHDMGRSGGWLWLDNNNMAGWERGDPAANDYGAPESEEPAISEINPEREAILRSIAERQQRGD